MLRRPTHVRAGFCLLVLVAVAGIRPATAQLSKPTALLKGEIRSEEDQSVVAGLQVAVLKGTERVTTAKTNIDGKFTAIVPPGSQYRLTYTSPNYAFREDTIEVPAADKYQEIPVRAFVMPLRDNQDLTPKQAVFAKGSSKIDPVTAGRLDQLAGMLKRNPRVKLEIAVYPDMEIRSKKDAAQQRLLDERTVALRSFFITRNVHSVSIVGIPRLSGTGVEAVSAKVKKGKKPSVAAPGASIAQSVKITGKLS